jgi:hypothetical protein
MDSVTLSRVRTVLDDLESALYSTLPDEALGGPGQSEGEG